MSFQRNHAIRKELFAVVEELTDDQFNKIPSNDGWSPKQIFEHLVRMEIVIATNIERELNNPDSPKAGNKPIIISTNRLIKVEAPGYTTPSEEYKSKLEIKKELDASRKYLLDVYESGTEAIFREKSFKHPLFGQIPLRQWFPFVGLHEKRHIKQLKKTIKMNKKH